MLSVNYFNQKSVEEKKSELGPQLLIFSMCIQARMLTVIVTFIDDKVMDS